jgi:hypothetical protein
MKINSRFIVVKHDAKKARLHYDLRFVMPNSKIWISFAVRKGVPESQGKKVLAVRTHDHSEEEALMLGTIESGYGAGTLTKYDDGRCTILKFTPSHMIVDFNGRKIKGVYHLINIAKVSKRKSDYKKREYILFKGKTISELAGYGAGKYRKIPIEDEEESEEGGETLKWSIANKSRRVIAAQEIYNMLKKQFGE